MKPWLAALMLCRNEEWIIGLSLRAALKWCDVAVVLLHSCTDHSQRIVEEIAAEHPGRVNILASQSPLWCEMEHRQALLVAARAVGATHMAIVDADEVLTGNLLGTVREQIAQLPPGGFLRTRMFCPWRSIHHYRSGQSIWANRTDFVLAFADSAPLCWSAINGYDHHHRQPINSRCVAQWTSAGGGVMHLQFVQWERLTAKHALYKMSERVKFPHKPLTQIDQMYNLALDESGLLLEPVPVTWWQPYLSFGHLLDTSNPPWQVAECERLLLEYGPSPFVGLNLFGVVEVKP